MRKIKITVTLDRDEKIYLKNISKMMGTSLAGYLRQSAILRAREKDRTIELSGGPGPKLESENIYVSKTEKMEK